MAEVSQVRLNLTDAEFEKLWRVASSHFDPRDDGGKSWTKADKKKAIQLYVIKLALDKLSS